MPLRWSAIPLLVLPGALAIGQEKAESPSEINKPFRNPDVKQFVERFENDSREVYARRRQIVEALALKPGMAVADVGAGTGAFTRLFAEKVGDKGKVFAVDIAPAFLEHIAAESKRRGQSQVVTALGTQDSCNLKPGSVDVAFLCDTYHHLEHPEKVLASIRRSLRPGGRMVVIDFDRREGTSSEFVLKHIRAGREVFFREIESAGFERVEPADAPSLKENFFAEFRKKGQAGEDARANTPPDK